jgi:cathepsin X
LISCDTDYNLGCHGGEPLSAYKYIKDNFITDETCSIYTARGHDNGHPCSNITLCRNCDPGTDCYIPDSYYIYQVDEYAGVYGEDDIMQEVYQRGPVACGVSVTDALENYTSGIFIDDTGRTENDHEVSIVGWGEEDGQKYWKIRNSWGSHWGEQGFFKLIRGVNNLNIESNCTWATPVDTWTEGLRH